MFNERTTLQRLLLLKALSGGQSLVERTALGNPLTFGTDVAKPLKSLLIPFTPIQSGTGDPSPENIRPILPWNGLTVEQIGENAWGNATTQNVTRYLKVTLSEPIPPGTYTITATVETDTASRNVGIGFAKGENMVIETVYLPKSGRNSATFTINETVTIVYLYAGIDYSASAGYTATYKGILIEAGTKAPTETDIVFPPMGKNLLNPASFYDGVTTADGQYTFNRSGYTANLMTGQSGGDHVVNDIQKCPILPAGNYVFSTKVISGGAFASVYKVSDEGVRTGVSSGAVTDGEYRYTLFTLDEASRICICRASNTNPSVFEEPQIESGTQRTAYEPFDNSVYGGTLDVVSGVLTVTHVCIDVEKQYFTISGSGSMQYMQTAQAYIIQHKPKSRVDWAKARQTQKMDCAVIANPYSETTFGNYIGVCFWDTNLPTAVRISKDLYDSLQNDDDSVSICYEIDEPFEIQLTPAQITALIGNNTIWSDADGSMTCVYLVSSRYAEDHPVGGLGSGLGSGLLGSGTEDNPDDPIEDPEEEIPDNTEEGSEPDD